MRGARSAGEIEARPVCGRAPRRWWRRHRCVLAAVLASATTALCVAAAPATRVVTGTHATALRDRELAAGAVLDLRAASFLASAANRYPLSFRGGSGACIAGGTVQGQYDRGWSWDRMHDVNNAALAFENPGLTVDGLRADNVTDGIRPRPGVGFTIANVWLSYVRDDCVENDHLEGGLVRDALLDGCYVAFSARPSPAKRERGLDGSGKLWTIRDSLVRLAAMPGPRGGTTGERGHGVFFKWHNTKDPTRSLSPRLALHGNIFLAEGSGPKGGYRLGVPPARLASCSNNVVVWLGSGKFPGNVPDDCFRVTTDRRVWDDAVATWHRRHGYDPATGARVAGMPWTACGLDGPPTGR